MLTLRGASRALCHIHPHHPTNVAQVSTAEGPRVITTQNVLIATGGRAWRPDFPGVEHTITSDEALDLKELPRRIVVVGGGYIGIEMACVFKGYGSDTHYFFRGDAPLAGFDRECREFVAEQARGGGVVGGVG